MTNFGMKNVAHSKNYSKVERQRNSTMVEYSPHFPNVKGSSPPESENMSKLKNIWSIRSDK
jgi:hypothetical protein